MGKNNHKEATFVVCITDSEPDLEVRKIYRVLPDEKAAKDNYLLVMDESGEDYLYPSNYFVFIEVPKETDRNQLLAA